MSKLGRSSFWALPSSLRSALRSCGSGSLRHSSTQAVPESITLGGNVYPTDEWTNVPSSVISQYHSGLHVKKNHPLSITRQLIESRFPAFEHYNTLPGVVSVYQNFDSLGFAADHPGRSRTDTYFINKDTLLRTHTSAHEVETFRANKSDGYTIAADVYRRDAVDRSHYPIFHQMEGALTWDRKKYSSHSALLAAIRESYENLPKHDLVVEDASPPFDESNPLQSAFHSPEEATLVSQHLKRSLEDMVVTVFTEADKSLQAIGQSREDSDEPLKVRWLPSFFPHTSPSYEMEVWWRGDWLEVLGCGVIDQPLLVRADQPDRIGWAFGLGLERIAMLLFGIPDIRLFWSRDKRFLSQFDENGPIKRFQAFSKHPAAPRDVAFWLPKTDAPVIADTPAGSSSAPTAAGGQVTEPSTKNTGAPAFHENDLMEVVRSTAGDSVEDVKLIDDFTHPKTNRRSLCYRITYRSLEKTLTTNEANTMHEQIRNQLVANFGVELR